MSVIEILSVFVWLLESTDARVTQNHELILVYPLGKIRNYVYARFAQLLSFLAANQKVPGSFPGLVEG